MRNLLLATAATFIFATAAMAGEVKFPADDPVAVITIPDGWTAKEVDGALDVSSPEDSVYLGIEAEDAAAAQSTMSECGCFPLGSLSAARASCSASGVRKEMPERPIACMRPRREK